MSEATTELTHAGLGRALVLQLRVFSKSLRTLKKNKGIDLMNFAIANTGYMGLPSTIVLTQHIEEVISDIVPATIKMLHDKQLPTIARGQ
jgi:hypothetical protein